jgi:microcystin-dependent protein
VVREAAIPAHNQLCEQLEAEAAAADIGAAVPGSGDMPPETPKKLQSVLEAMLAWAKKKLGLKADKASTYTKQQVDEAINEKVAAIGAGDMTMAVYDPESKKKPYMPAEEAMAKAVYDPQSKGKPYIPAEEVQALIADLKREIPQPGHWVFAPYRLTYGDESVNSKRYPWVNYDDDLDKTVYAALYAAIGDTMSDGAADGMFNCKKLAERFPLVCGANFSVSETGGEKEHTLTIEEMPKHTHATTVAQNGSEWVAAWFSQNGTIHGKSYSGEALPHTASSGNDVPHNNMPPFLAQVVHIKT